MRVIAKMQAEGNSPVEATWCGKAAPASEVDVILSVAQLLNHAKDESPWSPKVLEIRIEL